MGLTYINKMRVRKSIIYGSNIWGIWNILAKKHLGDLEHFNKKHLGNLEHFNKKHLGNLELICIFALKTSKL